MKLIQEFWIEALVGLALATMTYFGKKIPTLWRRAATRRFRKVIAHETAKHSLIQRIQNITGAKRAVLCKAHNGGGIPVRGKPLRITIDWEEFDSPIQSLKSEWQGRTPDAEHLKALLDLTRLKQLTLSADKLPSGEVKDTHDAEGLVYSLMKEIVPTKYCYWYIVLFYDSVENFTPEVNRKLKSYETKLKSVLTNSATLYELEAWAIGSF